MPPYQSPGLHLFHYFSSFLFRLIRCNQPFAQKPFDRSQAIFHVASLKSFIVCRCDWDDWFFLAGVVFVGLSSLRFETSPKPSLLYPRFLEKFPTPALSNFGPLEPLSGLLLVGACILTGTIMMFFSSCLTRVSFDDFVKFHKTSDDKGNVDADEWSGFIIARGFSALLVLGFARFVFLLITGVIGQIL